MHGAATALLIALARTRPARAVLARLEEVQRHPRTQAAAVGIVDFARRRPQLTLTALAALLLVTGLAARAAVATLSRLTAVTMHAPADVAPEPPPVSSMPPSNSPVIPEPEPEPTVVATLPPLAPDLEPVVPERAANVTHAVTPILLPRPIVDATHLPAVHFPGAVKPGTGAAAEAPRLAAVGVTAGVGVTATEPSSVVVAFKPEETSAGSPIHIALAEAPAGPGPAGVDDGNILPVGCASCGGGGGTINPAFGPPDGFAIGEGGCSSCGGATCVPGKTPCYPCSYHSTIGRFLCGVYECVCCPDPCYEPRWTPVTDTSFFTDAPRPITQQRFRWDAGMNMQLPDRAMYNWSPPPLGPLFVGIPYRATPNVNYNTLSVYTEIATNRISFFTEMPYVTLNAEQLSQSPAAGFGDINLGTKSLLYDCELFQVSLQMKTYILSGNFSKGLGTGHMSLEPSILFGLRISPDTYLQTQVGEWIPFSTSYAGACLKASASLNQVLWRILPNVPLIGSWELETLSFQDGAYTDPYIGPWQKASGYTYINAGPGLRLFVCDRIDFGIGSSFALTEKHFAQTLFRSEFRLRY